MFTKQQVGGLVGAFLLILGLFTPLVNIPLLGNSSFFEIRNFNGLLDYSVLGFAYGIFGLGVASVLLTVLNYCRGLFITGFLSLAAFAFVLKQFNDLGNKLNNNEAASFIMSLTNTTVSSKNLCWGWIVLFAGATVLLIVPFFRSEPKGGLE